MKSDGRQGIRKSGERAQLAGGAGGGAGRPATVVRVVPLWEGLSKGVRG